MGKVEGFEQMALESYWPEYQVRLKRTCFQSRLGNKGEAERILVVHNIISCFEGKCQAWTRTTRERFRSVPHFY